MLLPTVRVLWECLGWPYASAKPPLATMSLLIDSWPCRIPSPTNTAINRHPIRQEFLLEGAVWITATVGAPPLFLPPGPPPSSFWPPFWSSCHDRSNATDSGHYCRRTHCRHLSHCLSAAPFVANSVRPIAGASTTVKIAITYSTYWNPRRNQLAPDHNRRRWWPSIFGPNFGRPRLSFPQTTAPTRSPSLWQTTTPTRSLSLWLSFPTTRRPWNAYEHRNPLEHPPSPVSSFLVRFRPPPTYVCVATTAVEFTTSGSTIPERHRHQSRRRCRDHLRRLAVVGAWSTWSLGRTRHGHGLTRPVDYLLGSVWLGSSYSAHYWHFRLRRLPFLTVWGIFINAAF